MRRIILPGIAVLGSVVIGCRLGERRLEKVDIFTQYHGVTFVEKFKIWATGADELVAKDAFYEHENYVYDGAAVSLTALRGETEAFQLVVNADYGNVNDVGVSISPLIGPDGSRIPESRISVFFEYYLTLEKASDYRGRAGEVPDPLPPLAEPFDLAKGEAQPLFVVVDVPRDAARGEYAGVITVKAKKAETQKLKLRVTVLEPVLDASSLPPAFLEPDYRAVAAWEGGKPREPAKREALAPYMDLLTSRGVRPFDCGYCQRRLTASEKRAVAEWAEVAACAGPVFFYLSPAADGGMPSLEEMGEEYKTLYDAFDKGKPSEPVVWAAFEGGSPSPLVGGPASAVWWRDLAAGAKTWPGAPALAVACSPYRGAPGVSLAAAASYWAPRFSDVALSPGRYRNLPKGNRYFIRADDSGGDILDGRRAGARLISWYGYLWRAAGLATLAPPANAVRPRNPWLDDPMAGTAAAFGNGLGTWFYPGGPAGIDKPVSSIRLELLRQGLEDWALFRMVEKKRGRAYVEERLKALLPYAVDDLRDVSTRVLGNNQIFELRQAMLAEVAGGAAAGTPVDIRGRVVDARGRTLRDVRVGGATFATYTAEDGSYRLRYRESGEAIQVSTSGFDDAETRGGVVTLYRGLKGLLPVFDFEAGIDAAFWLSGDEADALAASEERDVVREGRVALAAEFPCGRTSRVVNLYPRLKDFSKHHSLEFALYNPNYFVVDVWLLLLDDEALTFDRQYRRKISIRPRAWTRVSYSTKYLRRAGEPRFAFESGGSYALKPGYALDLSHVVGVGFEADGLTSWGGKDNSGSYKVIIDDVKLVIFD